VVSRPGDHSGNDGVNVMAANVMAANVMVVRNDVIHASVDIILILLLYSLR
jgi:hypothetical protein